MPDQLGHQYVERRLAADQLYRLRQVKHHVEQTVGDQLGHHHRRPHVQPQDTIGGQAAERGQKLTPRCKHLVRVLENRLAHLGQLQLAARPVEQLAGERFFQLADLRADRGLGEMEPLAGVRDAAVADHHPEIEKVQEIQILEFVGHIRSLLLPPAMH